MILLERVTLWWKGRRIPSRDLLALHGRWIWVGPHGHLTPPEEARSYRFPPDTVVLPPFVDAHMHLAAWGVAHMLPTLEGTRSLEEVLERIREGLQRFPDAPHYVFWGYDETRFTQPSHPDRTVLDRLTRTRPLVVRRICGHIAYANTPALEILRRHPSISPTDVDPLQGRLEEGAALRIRDVFPPTLDEWMAGILTAQEEARQQGVLWIHEFGTREALQAYLRLWRQHALRVRVRFYLYDEDRDVVLRAGIPSGFGDTWFRLQGLKLFLDGSVGGRTAAFFHRYRDPHPAHPTGRFLYTTSLLRQRLEQAKSRRIQLAFHAIGDRAIHRITRLLEEVLEGGNVLRHRIEHFEFPTEQAMERAHRLPIYLSMQPVFRAQWGERDGFYAKALGKKRAERNNPFPELIRWNVPVAFGTDGMPFSLRATLESAVAAGLTVQEALHTAGEAAAAFTFEEEAYGFQPGALADAVIARWPEGQPFPDPPVAVIVGGDLHPLGRMPFHL